MLRIYVLGVTIQNITRFGVSIEPVLLKKFDEMIRKDGYTNRSEALRDQIRSMLIQQKIKDPQSNSIGTLTMIYDHHMENLTNKLLAIQHDHHDEILTTTHIHIDHNNCLEVLVLKGKTGKIQHLANTIISLRGIKHGQLVISQCSLE